MATPTPHPLLSRRPGPGLDFGRVLLGAVVVAIGTLFLLQGADVLDAGRAIDHWWPVVVIAAGLFQLAEHPRSTYTGGILIAIGTVLLLATTNVLEGDTWSYVWPVVVIGVGLLILTQRTGHPKPLDGNEDEMVRASGVFGGPELASTSRHFRGASLTAIFGGVTLDLRQAHPVPEGATINATAAFGGVEVLVPHGWRITMRATPIFGGVEDKTDRTEEPPADAPTLHLDALAMFGGVEVKHEKK
jgi:predicted membrane protein